MQYQLPIPLLPFLKKYAEGQCWNRIHQIFSTGERIRELTMFLRSTLFS